MIAVYVNVWQLVHGFVSVIFYFAITKEKNMNQLALSGDGGRGSGEGGRFKR